MQRNIFLIAIAIFILLFLGVVIYKKPAGLQKYTQNPSLSPQPTISQPGQQNDENIIVSSPKHGDYVSFPILVVGKARVFESQLNYRIKDDKGNLLSQGNTTANATDAGQFGDFTITIQNLVDFTKGNIVIEVFDYSARDGSEIDKVTIPVTLQEN